jgi:hypothetical protein
MKTAGKFAVAGLPLLLVAGGCDNGTPKQETTSSVAACTAEGEKILYAGQFAIGMSMRASLRLDRQGEVEGAASDAYNTARDAGQSPTAIVTLHRPAGRDVFADTTAAIAAGDEVGAADLSRVIAGSSHGAITEEAVAITSSVSQETVTPAATVAIGQMTMRVVAGDPACQV